MAEVVLIFQTELFRVSGSPERGRSHMTFFPSEKLYIYFVPEENDFLLLFPSSTTMP